jgi:hypothetical protein
MTTTEDTLRTIIAEFPMYETEITLNYYQSNNFIETCEDYVLCHEALKRFGNSKDLKNEKEINDLRLVMTELKEELLSIIRY